MKEGKSISHGEKFRLFKKDEDKQNIYLELTDISECCFEIWSTSDKMEESRVVVKIPMSKWEKMIKDWNKKN